MIDRQWTALEALSATTGNDYRAVLTPADLERGERHRKKGYDEHASYPIDIELPVCGYCAGVAARCACDSVHAGVSLLCSPSTPVEAWTDGSGTTMEKPAGIGIVVARCGVVLAEASVPIGPGSNNIAETRAIGAALRLVEQITGSRQALVILRSDSKFALEAVRVGSTHKIKAHEGLVKMVAAVRRDVATWTRLTLEHVPGHAGVQFNERADVLAGAARRRAA